jgi:hypothetical protein
MSLPVTIVGCKLGISFERRDQSNICGKLLSEGGSRGHSYSFDYLAGVSSDLLLWQLPILAASDRYIRIFCLLVWGTDLS